MQNSHHQIIGNKQLLLQHWSIILIVLLIPLLVYAVLPILPTHDDWTSLTTPDFSPFFTKERFLFYGYHWRPFDSMIGYIVGRNPQLLFPAFNHILVAAGHVMCSFAVFRLLTVLRFKPQSVNISTAYFFITPAAMATVTAVDSQNQLFALAVDIIAFLFYIKGNNKKYIVWPFLIFLATLFKENGLMWAIICPVLAYGFERIDKKTFIKDLLIGLGIILSYAIIITITPRDIIIHPEYVPSVMKVVKNAVKFIFSTFITIDYIYLLHQPNRNLWLAAATFLLAAPFLYYIFFNRKLYLNKKIACTIVSMLIAVAPHVLTVFSMMHTYAGLALLAILIAYSIDTNQHSLKFIVASFLLFVVSSTIINRHLVDSSIQSGLTGKQMAAEAIHKTGKTVKNVYLIIIEDDYPKLSSFCVIPNEAFGWGIAACYETNYKWPELINDTTIERSSDAMIKARKLGTQLLNRDKSYDCVWIVDHTEISVMNRPLSPTK